MTGDGHWLTEKEQTVWRTWVQLSIDLQARLGRDLQQYSDLSYPDYSVLVQLTDSDSGSLRVTDLATALKWERSRVSHHIKRMEGRGLVRRATCTQDARVAYIEITTRGQTTIEQAAPRHVSVVNDVVFSGMTEHDLVEFQRLNVGILKRLAAFEKRNITEPA